MIRIPIATAIVAWIVWSTGLGGCAHAQRAEHEALRDALDEATRQSSTGQEILGERASFDIDAPLEREALVLAVLARNPNLEAARQAWRGALSEHPQARSLEDTMASYALAPLSIRSDAVRFGQVVRIEQRFPTPGKFRFAGEVALAEAEAMQGAHESVRLTLALMASSLFDDYSRVTRVLALNDEHRQLIEDVRASAMIQYEAGRVSQQDVLQAEVELAHIVHQRVMLQSERKVIVAQINGLLHQRPEIPLPAPPRTTEPASIEVPQSESLQIEALDTRPELHSAQSQLRAADSAVGLARRDYSPAIGLIGEYNSMWAETQHQWMAGASLNLPLQIRSRKAAVDQSQARAGQAAAELSAKRDEVRVEVDQARQRVITWSTCTKRD
jgi:outer membrane protein, heavy metal efflux system